MKNLMKYVLTIKFDIYTIYYQIVLFKMNNDIVCKCDSILIIKIYKNIFKEKTLLKMI